MTMQDKAWKVNPCVLGASTKAVHAQQCRWGWEWGRAEKATEEVTIEQHPEGGVSVQG